MSSKAEDTKEKVTAASVEGVHLIVRNTKSWSNTELRKKCKIQDVYKRQFSFLQPGPLLYLLA